MFPLRFRRNHLLHARPDASRRHSVLVAFPRNARRAICTRSQNASIDSLLRLLCVKGGGATCCDGGIVRPRQDLPTGEKELPTSSGERVYSHRRWISSLQKQRFLPLQTDFFQACLDFIFHESVGFISRLATRVHITLALASISRSRLRLLYTLHSHRCYTSALRACYFSTQRSRSNPTHSFPFL